MNIDPVVEELNIREQTSSKTGKTYECIYIKLINGYESRIFLHPAEMQVIKSLLKSAKS